MMKRTYHYDEATKQMVEGPAPRGGADSGDGYRFSDRLYSDNPFLGADGTVINSRRKHRDYMRRNNLTTADDFKKSWDDASHQRADFYTKGTDNEERRAQIARAFHDAKEK
jgi:hypothetical protein